MLDAVEVHGHGTDVAGEAHAAAIRRDAHGLVDVGPVEHQRVGAVLAFDDIATIARIPDERVVTRAELCRIVAAAARDDVVAIAAEQRVVAVAAGDRVVARAAVDRQVDEGSETVSGRKSVVAAVHVEDEIFGRPDVEAERRGAEAIETHARAVGNDRECLGSIATVDLGGIDAVAAFEQIGAVAGIPNHAVVAGFAEHLVVAGAADQRVVAVAAEQQVVAAFAKEGVVAGAAEQLIRA